MKRKYNGEKVMMAINEIKNHLKAISRIRCELESRLDHNNKKAA